MINRRKFSQTVVILTFALAAWVTYMTVTWMVDLDLAVIEPTMAGIAFGVPSVLITLMFGIFKTVYTQYTETGLRLEQNKNGQKPS